MTVTPPTPFKNFKYSTARRDFNAAAFGVQPDEWIKEEDRGVKKHEPRVHTSAARKDEVDEYNELVRRVELLLCEMLRGDKDHPEWLTLYHNTTAGLQRVLLKVRNEVSGSATLLTTDMEYPGVMAAIHEYWEGPVAIAPVSDYMWSGEFDHVEQCLRAAVRAIQPAVTLFSHVDRSTGHRLSDDFVTWLSIRKPRPFVILDGAQAIGNIFLSEEFLKKVDFYATSGQKWLCGTPALGAVIARPDWKMKDQAQSYTRDHGSGGTGNDQALRSLAFTIHEFLYVENKRVKERPSVIEEWNIFLAGMFVDLWNEKLQDFKISEGFLRPIVATNGNKHPQTGIVTIRSIPEKWHERFVQLLHSGWEFCPIEQEKWTSRGYAPRGAVRYALEFGTRGGNIVVSEKIPFSVIRDTPLPDKKGHKCERFSFHIYHEPEDVIRLVEALLGQGIPK